MGVLVDDGRLIVVVAAVLLEETTVVATISILDTISPILIYVG